MDEFVDEVRPCLLFSLPPLQCKSPVMISCQDLSTYEYPQNLSNCEYCQQPQPLNTQGDHVRVSPTCIPFAGSSPHILLFMVLCHTELQESGAIHLLQHQFVSVVSSFLPCLPTKPLLEKSRVTFLCTHGVQLSDGILVCNLIIFVISFCRQIL